MIKNLQCFVILVLPIVHQHSLSPEIGIGKRIIEHSTADLSVKYLPSFGNITEILAIDTQPYWNLCT